MAVANTQYMYGFNAHDDEVPELLEELEVFKNVVKVVPKYGPKSLTDYEVLVTNGIMADMLASMLRYHSIPYCMEIQEVPE